MRERRGNNNIIHTRLKEIFCTGIIVHMYEYISMYIHVEYFETRVRVLMYLLYKHDYIVTPRGKEKRKREKEKKRKRKRRKKRMNFFFIFFFQT